jgi:hypothetical protein
MFIEVKDRHAVRPMMLNVRHIVQVKTEYFGRSPQRGDPPPEPNGTEILLSNGDKLEVEELYEELRAQILIVVDDATGWPAAPSTCGPVFHNTGYRNDFEMLAQSLRALPRPLQSIASFARLRAAFVPASERREYLLGQGGIALALGTVNGRAAGRRHYTAGGLRDHCRDDHSAGEEDRTCAPHSLSCSKLALQLRAMLKSRFRSVRVSAIGQTARVRPI